MSTNLHLAIYLSFRIIFSLIVTIFLNETVIMFEYIFNNTLKKLKTQIVSKNQGNIQLKYIAHFESIITTST